MNDACGECDGRCCRYFCFEIDEPDSYEEFEDIRWYLCHEGVRVHIDEGDWYMCIANPCKMLDADNRCRIYEDRPLLCRKYSPANCDLTSGDYGYEEEFCTPEELEAYARRTLGEEAFVKARDRARRKVARKRARQLATARAGR